MTRAHDLQDDGDGSRGRAAGARGPDRRSDPVPADGAADPARSARAKDPQDANEPRLPGAGDARLFGSAVEEALARLAREELRDGAGGADELAAVSALRRTLDPDLAREAYRLHALRKRSRARFPSGALRYLTAKGLEQASAEPVAAARAARIARCAPGARVVDVACGLGSDAMAMARVGLRVLAVERDAFTLRCARANAEAAGLDIEFLRADAERLPLLELRDAWLFVDPDRRAGRGDDRRARARDSSLWSPPLGLVRTWAQAARGVCVKLPPAFDSGEFDVANVRRAWQWVGLKGQLSECVLWTGDLARTDGTREALLLDGRGGVHALHGDPRTEVPPLAPARARAVRVLAEVDASVRAAGLLGHVARQSGLAPLAERIAYLGGDALPPDSPFLHRWRVLGCVPADRKRVRALLAAHDVGPVTVKKRGHPDDAATLAKRFAGSGRKRGTLVITRLDDGHAAFLVEPAGSPPDPCADPTQ